MSAEESSRPEASTVQRTDQGPPPPESTDIGRPEAAQIEQAKTVIRGSSRVDRSRGPMRPPNSTPAAVAQVLLGQYLNQFRLEEMIGGGGMGAVFRAHDERLDRTVAIKVVPFVTDDADLQRRFRNEAQSAAKLDHPGIARVYDAGSHDDWHYIVFEYIEGTNIRDLVTNQGVLPIDDAVYYTSQLADALQHAADRGIVHRDIKPSNVLIGGEGVIKLVDMGLARSDSIDLSEDMTASGVTLGTFDYISPEQAKDPRDADLRSDIYSLGCTLYFMLTGSPPYPGGTMLQKLLSHGSAPPPNAQEIRPDVSDNLVAVLQKMLAKKPADRYQTANDLIADLREVALRDGLQRCQSLSSVEVRPPAPLVQWVERQSPWMAAAIVLMGVAAWLQFDANASRVEMVVSPSAIRPEMIEAASRSDAVGTPINVRGDDAEDAAPEDAVDSSDSMAFGPPEEPPQFSDVRAPAELTDGAGSRPVAPDPETLTDPEPTTTADDPDLSQADSSAPHVIRLMGSDFESSTARDADGAALAATLTEALDLAAKYGASRIELAVPVIYSPPVRLDVDELLITSTVGGSTIVFESTAVAPPSSRMIAIGSHQIEFDDVHFVWNVPGGDPGGAMFSLNDNRLVRFTDCSVTINNPGLREEVYAFEVRIDPDAMPVERRETIEDYPTVWLELNNVIVRGQMSMLHMDHAAQLLLFWDNGLLAITGGMIDTAGSRRPLPADAGPLLLSLTRVTAHAPGGIVRMRLGSDGGQAVPIDRFARKSAFVVDSEMPHFEFTGVDTSELPQPLLRLRGASNAYAVGSMLTEPLLRLVDNDGRSVVTTMEELISASPPWADETSPRWSVEWSTTRFSEIPASQRLPSDYAQQGMSAPGFDEDSLPIIPAAGPLPTEVSRRKSAPENTGNREQL